MIWSEAYLQGNPPTAEQIQDFIKSPLWNQLCTYLETEYAVTSKTEYSKCSMQSGWNVKYKKSGRAVCTLYPEDGYYICMVSVGGKAAEGADEVLVECTPYVREVYAKAKPFNGSRWLMINVTDALILEDVKALIRLRMASK